MLIVGVVTAGLVGLKKKEDEKMRKINEMMAGALIMMVFVGCTTTPLPKISVQSRNPEISISADRAIVLNGQAVNLADIGASLAATGQSKDAPVLIRADKSVPYQTIFDVMNHLRGAGFSHISLAAK